MQLISQRILIAELKRLRQLALTATYSFEQTRKSLLGEVRKPGFNKEARIILSDNPDDSLESFQVLHKLKSQASRYLQELLFTRSISAFEVFLIDSIREIGEVVPDKFKSTEPIPYTREQISSFSSIDDLRASLLDKDCRQLSSGGFLEITKFYKNKLQIDYRSLHPGMTKLEEYHDRRHLLVHKLGQVDESYGHKHNSTAKKLSVDLTYLKEVIDDLLIFSEQLNIKIAKELFGIPVLATPGKNRNLYVFKMKDSDTLPDCLKPDYQIRGGLNSITLKEILLKTSVKNGRWIMAVEGDGEIIDLYSKSIYYAHTKGKLEVKFANPRKLGRQFLPNKYREEISELGS